MSVALTNEQQNQLDNLRIPIKSFRIFALEEVIRTGDSPEILSVLEEISPFEEDPECAMLIQHAIVAVKERLAGTAKSEKIQITDVASFLTTWKESDDNQRMDILSNLPPRLPKDIRSIGPELLKGSSHIVEARVIRSFGRNWPEDKYSLILEKLNSDSLVLKLAALRTMVHTKPEALLSELPVLLVSSDPEIKALAIRALAKIDKEEALNHLQALLLSPTQNERLAGIQNCPFLPFDMVKPLLLKYFAAETNIDLLTKAGWILEMNPDVEVPFKLFEIAERCPAKKAELVKTVLNEAVKLLEKSGILGNQFAAYTKKLQAWVSKRNALRFVKQVASRLDGATVPPEIDKNIKIALKQPIVLEAFKESLSWPVSNMVKQHIADYLGIKLANQATENKVIPALVAAAPTENLSQLEVFATMTAETASAKLNQILLTLNHKGTQTEIKVAALNCLTRCRLSGAEEDAVRLINSHEIAVATAAVEYLGIVNPDYVFPYLGKCLTLPDVGMKSVALGILKNFDYNQAISSLKAMLYSREPSQKMMAMECMNQFDFALIREMLTDFLCHDCPEEIIEAGLLHFAANPSADNSYSLYKIEEAHPGNIAKKARALREACPAPEEEIAIEETQGTTVAENKLNKEAEKQKTEAALKERLRVEKEKKKSKKPAYAYKSPSEMPERNSKDQIIAIGNLIKDFVTSKALPITIVVFIAVVAAAWVLFVPKGKSLEETRGTAVVANVGIVEGEVHKLRDGVVTLKTTSGEKLIMVPRTDGFKVPQVGMKLRIQIVPYRQTKDGTRVVKISGMRIIQQYSPEYGGAKK